MYALGDTNKLPPYKLQPYEERCQKLGLDKLSVRREMANAMMAYDLYNGVIDDANIKKKLTSKPSYHNVREKKLLVEAKYETDYGYNQPIAKLIRKVNQFSEVMSLSRTKYRTEIKRKLKYVKSDSGN